MGEYYQSTAAKLRAYYPFSETTIDAVASFAEKQAAYKTYQDFFAAVGMPESALHIMSKNQGVPVIDINPKVTAELTLVVHLPMANPLDPNQRYHAATLAGLFPNARIICFGNPSGEPYLYKEQNLTFIKRLGIGLGIAPHALVAAELDYLKTQGVTEMYQIGFSFGALKAVLESRFAPKGSVKGVVAIELVSHARNPLRLAQDFLKTDVKVNTYVDNTNLTTFIDARRDSSQKTEARKVLTRPINLAIASLLSLKNAPKLAARLHRYQPDSSLFFAWGTASELVDDARMSRAVQAMKAQSPSKVASMRLENLHHALANDAHLHAAIVYEALHQIIVR